MGVLSRRESLPAGLASARKPGWIRAIVTLPEAWAWGSLTWIASRASLLVWNLILQKLGLLQLGAGQRYTYGLAQSPLGSGASLLGNWQRWDAIHYVRIAAFGYVSPDLSAFHPLYPLLGRLVAPLTGGSEFLALLLISNLAALLAFVLFYQLASESLGPQVARQALIALVVFPSAFFLFAPYAESLALFLILLAYREARHARWSAALAAGVAAGLSHPTALPLSVLLAWEAGKQWTQLRGRRRARMLLLPSAPLLGTGAFLGWQWFEGLASWSKMHHDVWGVVAQWPWETLAKLPGSLGSAYFPVVGWINFVLLVVTILLTVWGATHLPRSLVAFQVTLVVLLLSFNVVSEPLSSWMRHSIMMFPMFIGLGVLCSTPGRRLAYAAIAIGLQLYFVALFLQWIWVG